MEKRECIALEKTYKSTKKKKKNLLNIMKRTKNCGKHPWKLISIWKMSVEIVVLDLKNAG